MTRTQTVGLWSASLACAVTGLAFAGMKYLMTGADPFSAYHHPLQPVALAAHVLLGPVLVFLVGWSFGTHVLAHLARARRARRSGVSLLSAAAPMIASGYLLQVVTGETARAAVAWAHGITGSLFVLSLAAHALTARRRAVRARRAATVVPEGARVYARVPGRRP